MQVLWLALTFDIHAFIHCDGSVDLMLVLLGFRLIVVLFDHVRIPRENMLMRFAKVTKEGKYIQPVHDKLSYGSMVTLRVSLINDAGWQLGRAVTVAVRYTTVRRQFNTPPNPSSSSSSPLDALETQVIAYSSVRARLFPFIALAYALIVASTTVKDMFEQMSAELADEQTNLLAQVHALTCGLKSWGTRKAAEGIEECRKAMGGHGYSAFSGISELFANYIPSNTYEGTRTLSRSSDYLKPTPACFQNKQPHFDDIPRFLLKELQKATTGSETLTDLSNYINRAIKTSGPTDLSRTSLLDPHTQLTLFEVRATRVVMDLAQQVRTGRDWADLNVECWNASVAHTEYVILKCFMEKIEGLEKDPNVEGMEVVALKRTLKKLCHLYALSTVSSALASFLSTQTLQPDHVQSVNDHLRDLLKDTAPDAVPMTDAFAFSDYYLNSALGRYDGQSYLGLWDAAQADPVNSEAWKTKAYEVGLVWAVWVV
ncbi:acyl-CoA dehydrogenase/oxidase C-terminal [Jimgerdemannia flammicorona]|uniref:acyl-CoA oxidase n=1 Tax=Jimgerdemannia flammicorona TaxID=994334 RepID=A0A433QG67_9FUNG|nr:acyl-CoA dehydrogenase/oxidase C-terminal [Jimgerdemannia flammicorona]